MSPLDPTNDDRAAWALEGLQAFAAAVGDLSDSNDPDTFSDLLADLMHLADRKGFNFSDLLRNAKNNYEAENFTLTQDT